MKQSNALKAAGYGVVAAGVGAAVLVGGPDLESWSIPTAGLALAAAATGSVLISKGETKEQEANQGAALTRSQRRSRAAILLGAVLAGIVLTWVGLAQLGGDLREWPSWLLAAVALAWFFSPELLAAGRKLVSSDRTEG